MNEKVTLQALAEQLASRHQMEQADAEAFVQTFVALIEEALQQEKYVKVKGLGTFKLIEMSGHNRVSFVPEASLRDLINKPFAHFETVVLNENTHFDDMTEEVKHRRLDELMAVQQEISADLTHAKIGKEFKVIIDRKEGDYFIGRTEFDSPEVDPEVLIKDEGQNLVIGSFYQVKVYDADDFDLYATLI